MIMSTKTFNELVGELLEASWAMLEDNEDKSVDDIAADCDALHKAATAVHAVMLGAPYPPASPDTPQPA